MRTKQTCKNHGVNPQSKRIVKQPWFTNVEDHEEIKKLMKRKIPDEFPETDELLCVVCNLEPHVASSCPWRKDQLPPGAVPGPGYDSVCLGCGKVGHICPGYGAYAVQKKCIICSRYDHWYWEDRCADTSRPCSQMWEEFKQALKEIPSSDLQNKEESAVWPNFDKQIKNKDVVMVGSEDADKDAAQPKVADKPEPSDLSERPNMVEYTLMVPNYVTYNHPKNVVPDLVRLFKEQNMVQLRSMDLKDRKHSDMVRDDNQLVS